MTKTDIENRIKELTAVAQQSIANHNSLLGRIAECESLLEAFAAKEAGVIEGEFVAAAETEMTHLGDQFVAAAETKATQVIDAEVSKL
jgi:hypothetical protein